MMIDTYAYSNRIRAVNPAQKATLALLLMTLSLVLDRPAVGLLATGWAFALATLWAKLPGRVYGKIVVAEGTFILLAVVGVAVSVSAVPPAGTLWSGQVGPAYFSFTAASLGTAAQLATRALAGAAALTFLAMTTPMTDLIALLRRLRMPLLMLDLMSLIYRFIFVLQESMQRMVTAQQARSGYANFRRGLISASQVGTLLFVESYRRSQVLDTALECRGGTGDHLRVLTASYASDRRTFWFGAAICMSMLLVRVMVR